MTRDDSLFVERFFRNAVRRRRTNQTARQRADCPLVVNPGHLASGWAAFFDRSQPVGKQVELMNLRTVDHAAAAADIGVGI